MERRPFRERVYALARQMVNESGRSDVEVAVDDKDPEDEDFDGLVLRIRRPSGDWWKRQIPKEAQYASTIDLTQIVRRAVNDFLAKG